MNHYGFSAISASLLQEQRLMNGLANARMDMVRSLLKLQAAEFRGERISRMLRGFARSRNIKRVRRPFMRTGK